jgi:DHA1 family bicyclomycin/chloramphenicol resistance-like MFS transporter
MLRSDTFAMTALLAALSAIGRLTTDMYLPSLPDIVTRLDATNAQGQLTISSYLVSFAIGQVLYGPLSDRQGRKPVLIGALALFCVGSLACMLSTSIHVLIAARALQAFGGCGAIVLARAVVRDLYSGTRAGRELSLISSVMAVAPVTAPLVGGVMQTAFGWRSIFFTLAAVGIALVTIVWTALPETLAQRSDEPVSPSSMVRSFGPVAREPAYLAYMGLATACYAGLFAWISAPSFVLQDLYGQTALSFGIIFALGSVGYMTGATVAARIVGRLGLNKTIGFGGAMLAAGGLGMIAALLLGLTSAVSLVLPMAVYLAGMGLMLPQSIAGAMMPFPERAGAASALLGFVQQSTASICGAIVGALLGASAWPLAAAVAFMGCMSLLLWVVTRTVRAHAAARYGY